MWQVERSEFWANLSSCGGGTTTHVGWVDLPERPKAADIRREVDKLLDGTGFRTGELDLTMRRFDVIMGDLIRTEPEDRPLDEFHSDSFSMDWWPNRSTN